MMKKLKILFVLQCPFSDHFGAGKVHFDLKKEFERMGHEVDTLSSDDYYPNGQSTISKIVGPLYTYEILSRLKEIAYKYDVIDANFNCIPFPKESFGFNGLLIYRSHGLLPVYRKAEASPEYQQMLRTNKEPVKLKTRFGNLYRMMLKKPGPNVFADSVKYADIIHCLNQEEHKFLLEYGIPENEILPLPNGISDTFVENANKSEIHGKSNIISFVGSWTLRKGIKDLNEILTVIDQKVNIDKFNLLGGVTKREKVVTFFDTKFESKLNVIPTYSQSNLVDLLKETKVGIFPSYIEGLPLAIIEQISCGIPVVAYDIPGSSEILRDIDPTLLIHPGNKKAFGDKVIEILNMDEQDYVILAEKCKAKSQEYLMSKVSELFIDAYFKNHNLLLEKHNSPILG